MGLTPSQTIGPFFHLCLTVDETWGSLAGPGARGERVTLICRVLDGDGLPVDDAMLELWQADASGVYSHPDDPHYAAHDPAFRGFGRAATNQDGVCVFETVKPGRPAGASGTREAPHIHVSVFARGLLKRAITRIYFPEDPAHQEDPVLAMAPAGRRETLLARRDAVNPSVWNFDIHLCGEHETVFFEM
jgi:protocatechuate 3,4-dioxygenase alpha subunit